MKKERLVRRELLVALAVVVLIALSAAPAANRRDSHVGDFEVLATVVKEVEDNYAVEVDSNALFYGALRGMLSVLDQHTTFLGPGDMEDLRMSISGKFGGLGIEISIQDGWLTIVTPIEDSPAFNAGCAAGDKIVEIDGVSTQDITIREAVNTLRGEPGTDVIIKVIHPWDLENDEDITVTRANIKIPSVKGFARDADSKWDFMLDKENKIGYVRLVKFQGNSSEAVKEAVDTCLADGMKALILDLRFNPGGVLTGAVEIGDMFIKKGLIVETRGRLPSENHPFRAKAEGTFPDFPMAILVNGSSASASEIVSGCLQDHGRAVIIGERTYGKGSVQRVKSMQDIMEAQSRRSGAKGQQSDFLTCGLKMTTARYYTPSGRTFDREHKTVSQAIMKEFTDSMKDGLDQPESEDAMTAREEKKRGGIVPDIIVEFTPEEHRGLLQSRRNASIIHSAKENAKKDGEDVKKEDKADEKKDGEEEEEEKEFVDTQLEKALEVLREKLSS